MNDYETAPVKGQVESPENVGKGPKGQGGLVRVSGRVLKGFEKILKLQGGQARE